MEQEQTRISLTIAQSQRIAGINAAIQQVQAQAQDKLNMLAQTRSVVVMTILEYNNVPADMQFDISPDGTAILLKSSS